MCSSHDTEDDQVPDNTKYMDLAEDNIEAAQCMIMANVVILSEAGLDLLSFLKYKSCSSNDIARTVSIYFYHLSLALSGFPLLNLSGFILADTSLVSFWQTLWFHFGLTLWFQFG